ncbi:Apple domain-containing protein [Aphelenchoides besseyi]|nr:Apple domain-containing protein [Aphelenchoides besseyi]
MTRNSGFLFCLVLLLIDESDGNVSHCFFLPNIALNGGTYDEIKTSDIGSCCIACARDPCCIAYTVDKYQGRCYLKSAISDSTKTTSFTSGIKANVYSGRGSIMKNIKIQGGTSTTVKLPNNEECVQFCTAYGMSSFSPPTEGSNEQQGTCSCMSRISSLEYSFGARSSIFPTDGFN